MDRVWFLLVDCRGLETIRKIDVISSCVRFGLTALGFALAANFSCVIFSSSQIHDSYLQDPYCRADTHFGPRSIFAGSLMEKFEAFLLEYQVHLLISGLDCRTRFDVLVKENLEFGSAFQI